MSRNEIEWIVSAEMFRALVSADRAIMVQVFQSLPQLSRDFHDLSDGIETLRNNAQRNFRNARAFDIVQHQPSVNIEDYARLWNAVQEKGTVYFNTAWMVITLAAAALEKLCQSTKERGVLENGDDAYDGVKFAKAVWVMNIAFKHAGEWLAEKREESPNRVLVRRLVGNETRPGAPVVFLKRCGIHTAEEFERRLKSCSLTRPAQT